MVEGADKVDDGVGVDEPESRSFSSSRGRRASLLGEYKMLRGLGVRAFTGCR